MIGCVWYGLSFSLLSVVYVCTHEMCAYVRICRYWYGTGVGVKCGMYV